MNETIGAKGGHNDYKKSLKIRENQKKKMADLEEKKIRELEKKVKRQQRYVLIKTLPIVIVGQTFKTLYDTATGKREKDIEEINSKWRIKEYGIDNTTESLQEERLREVKEKKQREVTVVKEDGKKIKIILPGDEKKTILDEIEIKDKSLVNRENTSVSEREESAVNEEQKSTEVSTDVGPLEEEVECVPISRAKGIASDDTVYEKDRYIAEDSLSDYEKRSLDKLKNHKIIDEFEKQLKDVRYDLRQLVFEYNILVDEANRAIVSEEMEIILDKLSEVISKIEELKRKIAIDDLDKYDDNYIYEIVEDYLKEFRDGKLVDEIKDSPLYVMIAEKLDEIDSKKDDFSKKVESKKEKFEEKEERFEELKEKYFDIDKINNDLIDFQNEQDRLLKEIKEKMKTATTVQEKVEVQVQAMNVQSKRLLNLLGLSMLFPGNRSARSMATAAAAYLYFVNNIVKPKTTTKKYRVITVKDYGKAIEKSIVSINDAIDLLGKTSKQIEKMISLISDEFKDYLGVIKEADELLSNLRKMNDEIKEKEYELEQIKIEQEKNLEKNNAKVKKIGEYPM